MYTTKRIISPNGKERIIVILCNVQYKDGCQPKEKIINIEKKEEEYIYIVSRKFLQDMLHLL